MLRKYFVQKYLNYHPEKDIKYIIGHSSRTYLKGAAIAIVLLFFLYIFYALLNKTNPADYWKWIFSFLGLVVLFKWVVDFLNTYLDCLILGETSLTLFLWEGLLEYKTEVFFWNKLSSISWSQKGIWDKIFLKGDLLLHLEHELNIPFDEVYMPKKWISKVTLLKQEYLEKEKISLEKDLAEDQESFEILVEAMGEVVKEYLGKNK